MNNKDILQPDVHLTVGGAVWIGSQYSDKFVGYMHPESFRDLMGEEAWQELLARPRIVCEYDYPDEKGGNGCIEEG